MGIIYTNKTSILCPFKSIEGMLNGCYDYGGSLENVHPCKGSLAPKSLRTPDVRYIFFTFSENKMKQTPVPILIFEPLNRTEKSLGRKHFNHHICYPGDP